MTGSAALVTVLVVPLAGAVAALLAGRRGAAAAGLLTCALAVAAAFALAAAVLAGGMQRVAVGGWAVPLGIELRADGLATAMLLMTAVIGAGIAVYAWRYFGAAAHHAQHDPHDLPAGPSAPAAAASTQWLFWPVWLLAWGALNALYLSGDLFNLYVTLELLGLAAVALVALAGAGAAAAALRYLLFALLGSMLYILGVELLYAAHQTMDLLQLRERLQPGLSVWLAAALMTAGLLVKTAIFPLHFWLPPAHGSAPTPVSAVLSALVVKAGFYLLARLWLDLFGTLPGASVVPALLGALGALAVLWGGVQALRQTRLKAMIAYSTVAQLGYLMIALPLAGGAGATGGAAGGAMHAAVLLAASHAAAKASMFMCAGSLLAAYGHDRIDAMAGFGTRLPITATAFALAALSLIGLPPTGGFVGKFALIEAAVRAGAWWAVAVVLAGSLLSAAFLFHALSRAFADAPADKASAEVPAAPQLAALALALVSVALVAAGEPLRRLLAVGGVQ